MGNILFLGLFVGSVVVLTLTFVVGMLCGFKAFAGTPVAKVDNGQYFLLGEMVARGSKYFLIEDFSFKKYFLDTTKYAVRVDVVVGADVIIVDEEGKGIIYPVTGA